MHTNGIKVALCAPTQRLGFTVCQTLERLSQIDEVKVFIDVANEPVRFAFRGESVHVDGYQTLNDFAPDMVIFAGKSFDFASFHSAHCSVDIPVLNLSWGQGVETLIIEPNDQNIRQMQHPIAQQILTPVMHMNDLSQVNSIHACVACGADIEGEDGILELMNQTRAYMSYDEEYFNVFPKPIAFNTISNINVDEITDYDVCKRIMGQELKNNFKQTVKVDLSFIQVPVIQGHHAVVQVTTESPLDIKDVIKSIEADPLMHHVNLVSNREYGQCFNRIAISQLNKHTDDEHSVSFHVMADELAFGVKQFVLKQIHEIVEISGAI